MNRSGNKKKIMPTFNVIVPEGRLSSEQKTRVAAEIGRTYKELTGVPENLTQVIFIEVKRGNQIVEFGRVVPEPGGEAAWIAALPEAERKEIEAIGRVRRAS